MTSKNKLALHQYFLAVADAAAGASDVARVKMGAVVVGGKGLISVGFNQMRSHPLQYKLNQLRAEYKHTCNAIHAEIHALSRVKNMPKKAVLYISRRTKDNEPAMARPCEGCMKEIKQRKIQTIVYTTDDGFAVEYI